MKKVGLVGLGFIGKAHLEAYRHVPNAEVTVICSKSAANVEDLTAGVKIISDYDELLKSQDIDVVDICVPTFLHEEYITKAARAGKHIICEKPLTLTVEAANRILHEVESSGVKLFVGHVLRFWPEYQVIKEYSQSEKLKNIEFVQAKRLGQVPTWSDWFQRPEKSGGTLFDLHIHDIDFVYYLLGEVERVYAVGGQNEYGAWNHVMTTLTFKSGAKAHVEASHRMPNGYPFTMSLRAQTLDSALDFVIKAGENIENIGDSQKEFSYYKDENVIKIEVDEADAFANELEYFVNCLEAGKENLVVPLSDVVYVLKLLEAIQESLETGREVLIE